VSILCLCNVLHWRSIIQKFGSICDVLEFIWMYCACSTKTTSLPLKPLTRGLKIRVAPLTNFMFGDSFCIHLQLCLYK
jgi:hypothetical protein